MLISVFHSRVFSWWRENGRILPWREKGVVVGSRPSVVSNDVPLVQVPTCRGRNPVVTDNTTTRLHDNVDLSVREKAFYEYFAVDVARDPYRVVVSEVMLQQTQVDRVIPKYEAWMKKWPTIQGLALAELSDVIIEWKGLGYNRRARFLWLLAQEIVNNRKGEWPTSEKELTKLPGIGCYTARAVMSFSMGMQVGVVDTNVKRILDRVFNLKILRQRRITLRVKKSPPEADQPLAGKVKSQNSLSKVDQHLTGKRKTSEYSKRICDSKEASDLEHPVDYFQFADELLPANLADPWNQALMDFGALICTAKSPRCNDCPIQTECEANLHAKKSGVENFATQLARNPTEKKLPKKSKDYANGRVLQFEQTDRFLRGKILDFLRQKELKKEHLITKLNTKFTQFNLLRIRQNIDRLIKEQMVKEKNNIVSL